MKRLALIGSKEFAQQIREFAEKTGEYIVVGYYDDFLDKGTIVRNLPVIGHTNDILDDYHSHKFDCLFIACGYTSFAFRERCFNLFKGVIPFANIIMSGVTLGKNVTIGEGVYIGENTVIEESTIIHDNVFIHGSTFIAHNNIIGSHTYLSGRIDTCGFCTIGRRCFLGIRVLVADHIDICDDSWIGIGCIVAKNIVKPGMYMTTAAKLYGTPLEVP